MGAESKIASWLRAALANVRGAVSVEYGLILALIVIAMFGAVAEFAGVTVGIFSNVATSVSTSS